MFLVRLTNFLGKNALYRAPPVAANFRDPDGSYAVYPHAGDLISKHILVC